MQTFSGKLVALALALLILLVSYAPGFASATNVAKVGSWETLQHLKGEDRAVPLKRRLRNSIPWLPPAPTRHGNGRQDVPPPPSATS